MENILYKDYPLDALCQASDRKVMLKDSTFFIDKKDSCSPRSNIKTMFELYKSLFERKKVNEMIYAP